MKISDLKGRNTDFQTPNSGLHNSEQWTPDVQTRTQKLHRSTSDVEDWTCEVQAVDSRCTNVDSESPSFNLQT